MNKYNFSISDCLFGVEYLENLGYLSKESREPINIMMNRLQTLRSQGIKNKLINYRKIRDLHRCIKASANEVLKEGYDDYSFTMALKGENAMPIDDFVLVAYTEHFKKEKEKNQEKDIR